MSWMKRDKAGCPWWLMGQSALAAAIAIGLLVCASGGPEKALLAGSFGSSSVILFCFPQSRFSQPLNVFMGHLLSAFVGLFFFHVMGSHWIWMAMAVGVSSFLMSWTGFMHPPAGSNPLLVYLGHASWQFLVFPVAIGAAVLGLLGWIYRRIYCGKEQSDHEGWFWVWKRERG